MSPLYRGKHLDKAMAEGSRSVAAHDLGQSVAQFSPLTWRLQQESISAAVM